MRVLVTGGAGFIGSHVVDRLLAAGIAPRIYDLRRSEHHRDVDAVVGDLLDLDAVRRAMDGCDAVVHLAAAADVDDVVRRPADAEAINSRGTLHVLEAARAAGVRRVVFASTIWVYGNASGAVAEDDALDLPDHLYTATKLAGEMYCRSYAELYGLQCTTLRFGIPYGPRARPAGVIPTFVRKALAGEPLTIAGEGLQSRRFVYVEDLAEGVVRALAPGAIGRTYNLVGDKSVSVRGIADTVRDLVGDVEIVHTPARAADFAGAEVSGARAEAELGWRPATPFAEGVRRYVAWDAQRHTTPAPARRPPRRIPAFVSAALSCLTVLTAAGMLAAYLVAVHAIGVTGPQDRTVAVMSMGALVGYLMVAVDAGAPRRSVATFAGWALMAAVVVTLCMPELREAIGLAGPDESIDLLGVAGGALGIGLAGTGLRLRRNGIARPTSRLRA